MKRSSQERGQVEGRRVAALVSLGILVSSSAGANEQPDPEQAGALAASHQLPRRVLCRTGPGLQLAVDARSLVVTGFVTEKNLVVKSAAELRPGSCAGMVHPDNNTGSASAPSYMKFGPQKNGPLRVVMGSNQIISFEVVGGRLTSLKAIPAGTVQDTDGEEDRILSTVRAWVQARDGEIEFSAQHDVSSGSTPESFQIPISPDAAVVRGLVR
jgi:hypothetical protein